MNAKQRLALRSVGLAAVAVWAIAVVALLWRIDSAQQASGYVRASIDGSVGQDYQPASAAQMRQLSGKLDEIKASDDAIRAAVCATSTKQAFEIKGPLGPC